MNGRELPAMEERALIETSFSLAFQISLAWCLRSCGGVPPSPPKTEPGGCAWD